MNKLNPSTFLGSDTTSPAVRQVCGISGSGKTTWMGSLISSTVNSPNLPEYFRVIIFDIKHEGYSQYGEVVTTFEELSKSIRKNRVTVIHPPDIKESKFFLNQVIQLMFDLKEKIEDFSATLILEESSTYIKSTPHGVPSSIKRLATQGRSKELSLILLNQRTLNSKWTDTQTSTVVFFRLPMPDLLLTQQRWGISAEEVNQRLSEIKFSYAVYDLESLEIGYYQPIDIQLTP